MASAMVPLRGDQTGRQSRAEETPETTANSCQSILWASKMKFVSATTASGIAMSTVRREHGCGHHAPKKSKLGLSHCPCASQQMQTHLATDELFDRIIAESAGILRVEYARLPA